MTSPEAFSTPFHLSSLRLVKSPLAIRQSGDLETGMYSPLLLTVGFIISDPSCLSWLLRFALTDRVSLIRLRQHLAHVIFLELYASSTVFGED